MGFLVTVIFPENVFAHSLGIVEQAITSDSDEQYKVAISGEKIVWTDYRNGNADIYMYDLSTNTEYQITSNSSYQVNSSIYGNKIVWQDGRNGSNDIYIATFTFPQNALCGTAAKTFTSEESSFGSYTFCSEGSPLETLEFRRVLFRSFKAHHQAGHVLAKREEKMQFV